MADQDTAIPTMDDRELFQSAMAEAPAQEAAPEPTPEPTEQPRDDQGRFAPKQAPTADAAPTQQPPATEQPIAPTTDGKDDTGGQVPSWRLREVREAREAAERRAEEVTRQSAALQQQLQQMQRDMAELRKPKSEPIDFFQDPDAALAQKLSPVEQRFARLETQVRLNSSRAVAIAMHGAKAVSEMEQAVEKATRESHPEIPHLAAQMRESDDPVNVAMSWFHEQQVKLETGGDFKAFKQKLREEAREEALKDPALQARWLELTRANAGRGQSPSTRPNVQLPPSLNKVPGAGVSNTPDDGDMSDRGLFRHAMSGPRR